MVDPWSRAVARAVGLVAPKTALKFVQARQILAHYTGASRKGPDQGWNPPNKSADAILSRDRSRLLARARDLERNSSHIAGAINKICNNVIYTGIFPQARIKTTDGKLLKARNDQIEQAWRIWAEHDRVQFYDLQELAARHLWIDGEFFVHRYFDPVLADRGICPANIEILESDHLDTSINQEGSNGSQVFEGIEYDRWGIPAAYYLFTEHPGDVGALWRTARLQDSKRIPANQVRHVFHQRRSSQGRGVSWLASIIAEMRDFSEYQSNERIANRLLAAFGLFIESDYPEHMEHHPFSGIREDAKEAGELPKYMEPARIDVLPPGMKAKVLQYDRPGQTYEPYTKTSLKSASVPTGLSYENFSNDYADATFSSARQAMLEERRGYRKLQFFMNRHFNSWIWRKWCGYAALVRIIEERELPVPVQWQNPGWPWIDPQKDAKGAQAELEMKITTRRRLAAERGLDWDEEIEELAEEEEIIRNKNLAGKEEE